MKRPLGSRKYNTLTLKDSPYMVKLLPLFRIVLVWSFYFEECITTFGFEHMFITHMRGGFTCPCLYENCVCNQSSFYYIFRISE